MTGDKRKPELKPDMTYSEMVHTTNTISEDEMLKNPAVINKINNLLKFFNEEGIKYDEFNINTKEDHLKGLRREDIFTQSSNKIAYPNVDYLYIPGHHDTRKWLQAVKEVYYKEKNGENRITAIRQTTHGWNLMETYDFLNWLKYYEGGTHLKYKFAQLWYENGAPGYFLHVKPDSKKEEVSVEGRDIDLARDAVTDEIPLSEKKRIIERQRNKIVGRLDSAEKLLRTHDGQIFAGKEFESLLETIYNLKKKVQMVNKISTSTKLYEDMIIREANIMNKKGFIKAAQLLFSLSQANNPPPNNVNPTDKAVVPPTPQSPTPPQQGGGSAGGLPSVGPGMPQNPPESAPNENAPLSKGISGFLENLETSNIGTKDESANEDLLEVEDVLNIDDNFDKEIIVVEAQEVSAPPIKPIVKTPDEKNKPLEIGKNVIETNKDRIPTQVKDFDHMIDSVFSHITINDIVAKLEDISKIYKTREIPRQLSIVDMMLDSKGLAAYFPSLSEAINKALESNNYISTRVDDILAKLTGGIEGRDLDLKGETQNNSPELDGLKRKLKSQDEKEKIRKKLRKEQADQELESTVTQPSKETPEVDIEEDLSQPVQTPEERAVSKTAPPTQTRTTPISR